MFIDHYQMPVGFKKMILMEKFEEMLGFWFELGFFGFFLFVGLLGCFFFLCGLVLLFCCYTLA